MKNVILKNVITVLLSLSIYPTALGLVVLADTFLGQAEFLNELLFGSRRELAITVLKDWATALPFTILLWLSLRVLTRHFQTYWTHIIVISTGLVATVLSFFPPFLPMIFGGILLWAGIFNLYCQYLGQRSNS